MRNELRPRRKSDSSCRDPSRRTPKRKSPDEEIANAIPSKVCTRKPSRARSRMLRTFKITGQSPAVIGRDKRYARAEPADTANSSPGDFIYSLECNPGL